MAATKAQERAKPVSDELGYIDVESAISRVLKVNAKAQVGWLRGRIQHLRRLGLTPPADRGPVAYTFEWAARWLLALRLERIGLNPVAVARFINDNWERKPGHRLPVTSLREVIENACTPLEIARKAKRPERSPTTGDVWLTIRFDEFNPDAFPQIGRVKPYWKPKGNPDFDNTKGFFDASRTDAVDTVAIPLTEVLWLLEVELGRRQ